MKTIELNFNLKDLDGNDVPDGNAGKLLSSVIGNSSTGPAVKFYEWAVEFRSGKPVQMTTDDVSVLKSFLETAQVPNFAKAQLIKAISEEPKKPQEEPKQ